MAVADSFDLWAASLCWGDEAFPAPVVVTNGRPASKASSAGSAAVTEEPAASFSGSPGSTVAAPQAEVDAAEGGMRFGPVLGKSEEVVRVADSEPVAPDDVPGMLSTQDILDHEASVDCGAVCTWQELPGGLGAEDVEPEPLPESCLAPSPRPPMGGDEPTLQYEAHQVLPRDPGTAKVGVPQESSAPRMPRTLTGASELTLQYEAWQAGDDATQLYEAVARPAAPAAPMRAQGLKGDAGSSNTIGLPAEARQTETLLYEAPDCRPSFGDVLRSYGEELQTLPYAVWEPEAQVFYTRLEIPGHLDRPCSSCPKDGTGEASIVTPACESTLEYAPWGGPVAGLPEARSQRVPQASSDAYVTPEKVSRSRGKTAQGTSGTRSGRQLAKVSATPSVLPGSGAEASRWLVPVKRRRREEEATPLQFSKITRPARPQVSNSAARPASRASILPAASMPSASVDGSQNSQGSSDARRQLTLAEAWRGVKRKVSCQEILDDSP